MRSSLPLVGLLWSLALGLKAKRAFSSCPRAGLRFCFMAGRARPGGRIWCLTRSNSIDSDEPNKKENEK
jgi:hypothetical protein